MNQERILLQDHHNKTIQLQPTKVIFYLQGKLIEAYDDHNDVYYLIFYKNRFLNAVKAIKLRLHSYIAEAFKNGILFETPHPIINSLISSNQTYKAVRFPQLIKKLEKHYHPHERAYILTFFESFIPKKLLFKEITSVFYEYRRNGQMFFAYRILRILIDFAPNHSLVKQLGNDLTFNKFSVLYSQKTEEIFQKDPIFAEKTLYFSKENEHSFKKLMMIYEKESRWLDLVAILIDKITASPTNIEYYSLKDLLAQHLSEQDGVYILERLASQLSTFIPLQKDLFDFNVKRMKINEVLKMMSYYDFKLNREQASLLGIYLKQIDANDLILEPDSLKSLLNFILPLDSEQVEKYLNQSATHLLRTLDPTHVKSWLETFKENYPALKIYEKIERLEYLYKNLDQMQTLGELFFEFKQWENAIECFSWEMELKPTDSKPLHWLSKSYRELGMDNEADVYKELCMNVQKHA
ncbi:hypothetical protein [Bacillus sp. B15-48]|uniref:hypothetical protein n=1 Tax=Bacillus sp. B15-48 TaxID=1548601 RepID=UPI00194004DD|nr:hypothetical protein [Bacillus sp. B15-48]MBM4762843.1 hypothetical protein [Bacillus sp. B15-48]